MKKTVSVATKYLNSLDKDILKELSDKEITLLVDIMEGYYQVKSQEESKRKYTLAIESVMGLIVAKPHLKDAFENCAKLASGKE